MRNNVMLFWAAAIILSFTSCDFLSRAGVDKNDAVVTLPYFKSCEDTLFRLKKFFRQSSAGQSYLLSLDINRFDVTPLASPEILGVVELKVAGNFNLLNGNAHDYLVAHAKSIRAECMHNNFLLVDDASLIKNYYELKERFDFPEVAVRIRENGEIELHFNDREYVNTVLDN